jgi:hypothetical protein
VDDIGVSGDRDCSRRLLTGVLLGRPKGKFLRPDLLAVAEHERTELNEAFTPRRSHFSRRATSNSCDGARVGIYYEYEGVVQQWRAEKARRTGNVMHTLWNGELLPSSNLVLKGQVELTRFRRRDRLHIRKRPLARVSAKHSR